MQFPRFLVARTCARFDAPSDAHRLRLASKGVRNAAMDVLDDEEMPLSMRLKRAAEGTVSDEDEPDWMRNHAPKQKPQRVVWTDDSDPEDILELKKVLGKQEADAKDAKGAEEKTKGKAVQEQVAKPEQQTKLVVEVDKQVVELPTKEEGTEAVKAAGTKEVMTRLPIVLPEKISRNKVLVECSGQDGSATDLSGDHGAVGRIVVTGEKGKEDVALDLKGTIYSLSIAPCCTMCVLGLTGSELKVEAMVNDFVQLREQTNLFDGEVGQGNYQGLFEGEDDDEDQIKRPTDRGGSAGGRGADPADTLDKGKGKKRAIKIDVGPRKKARTAATASGTKTRGRGRGTRGGSARGMGRRGKR